MFLRFFLLFSKQISSFSFDKLEIQWKKNRIAKLVLNGSKLSRNYWAELESGGTRISVGPNQIFRLTKMRSIGLVPEGKTRAFMLQQSAQCYGQGRTSLAKNKRPAIS